MTDCCKVNETFDCTDSSSRVKFSMDQTFFITQCLINFAGKLQCSICSKLQSDPANQNVSL